MKPATDGFSALADPTRRKVLDQLARQGAMKAGEIALHFPRISRPAVSKHLRVLLPCGAGQPTP